MLTSSDALLRTGLDAVALKPSQYDIGRAVDLSLDRITIDWEGRDHFPDPKTLRRLAEELDVRVTTPVRADGFDPLGDDRLYDGLPDTVEVVLVAGHPAYLSATERARRIGPRLRAAMERERTSTAWVGTEGIERLALATNATQFELLSRSTEQRLRTLRALGVDCEIAVYAPTVITDDEDAVLDAVGAYVARRKTVAEALPAESPVDSTATGRARSVLSAASRDFALVGDIETIRNRVRTLKDAGADHVVGNPARGIEAFLGGD